MRVGLVTTEFLPVWGGIGSYTFNICSALADKVEFHVFAPGRKVRGAQSSSEGFGIPNLKVHTISSTTDAPISTLGYQMLLACKLPQFIKENHLDVIHSTSPLADQLIRILGSRVPYVVTYHTTLLGQRQGTAISGVSFKDLDASEKLTLLFSPVLRAYESLSLRRTRNVIAVSKAVKDELVGSYKYEGKITIIPNGIDTNMFKPCKKGQKTRRVLFSGRFIALKGPRLVVRAMPEVLREHRDVVFVFAGAGKREAYERMLQHEGIPQENSEFCYVNYHNMPQLYNSVDMLVLPSLLESFPMTILEAMACGLPVIASNVGDVPELVKDGITGFLINKGDYVALADRINLLLHDNPLWERFSQNARELVTRNYSARVMGERTFKVYQEVLEESR